MYPHAIPAHLPLELEALPRTVPYLKATPAKVDALKGALKVAIAFKGDPRHENDRERSMPSLSALDPLFALEGVEFYSVQKGSDEVAEYASRLPNFHDLGASLNSMAETASVIEAIDFVYDRKNCSVFGRFWLESAARGVCFGTGTMNVFTDGLAFTSVI